MLNPDICRKCRRVNGYLFDFEIYSSTMQYACPALEGMVESMRLDRLPPAGCHHMLEQAVSESVNIDKSGGDVKC